MGVNNINSQIVEAIKKEMKNKNISLRTLSKMSMVAPSTIYDILENKGSPRLSTVQYLCKALGLEIKAYREESDTKQDELMEKISNLSRKKRETIKEIVVLLDEFNE